MRRPVLVTGGAGFIGSHFVKFLLSETPLGVIVLDKLTYCGNRDNLKSVCRSPRLDFIRGDIGDARVLRRLLPRVSGAVNFAAETHVDRSIREPGEFLKTNVTGLRVFLENVLSARLSRLLHISTDEVYGPLSRGSAREDAPLNPSSPYAASKAAGDLLIRAYTRTYGLPALIARSANNYGPFQYPEKVIPLFATNLIEGRQVPLYSRGENVRDWLFVEDNVRALWLLWRRGRPGEIYNIGAGNEITNLEMTLRLIKQFGAGKDRIKRVADRPGHDYRYSVNFSKIERLGYRPRVSFAEGLRRTLDWYRANEWWWKPLKNNPYTVK